MAKPRKVKPRCKAIRSYGSVWVAGRMQCNNGTDHESGLCATHRRQQERREHERKEHERGKKD